jgi:hypothetical protein
MGLWLAAIRRRRCSESSPSGCRWPARIRASTSGSGGASTSGCARRGCCGSSRLSSTLSSAPSLSLCIVALTVARISRSRCGQPWTVAVGRLRARPSLRSNALRHAVQRHVHGCCGALSDTEAVVDGEYSRAIEGVIGVVSRVIGGDGGKGAATGGDDGAGSRRAANPGVVSRDIGGDAVCEVGCGGN